MIDEVPAPKKQWPKQICMVAPDLAQFGLALGGDEAYISNVALYCQKGANHPGPHESPLLGAKFGYTALLTWFDAFPGIPNPLEYE